MSASLTKSIIHNPNHGLLDLFGDGTVTDGRANFYAIPSNLAGQTQDDWSLEQWGQANPLSPNELTGDALSYDPVYGWATDAWSSPASTSAFNIFQNLPSLGGGKVYQLTLGNTLLPPSSGWTDESDAFLSTAIKNPARGNLSQQITLSLDAKIVQSITQFTDAAAYAEFGGATNRIFSQLDLGFTLNYNGAGGLPIYSGFVQIVPWNSATGTSPNYETAPVSPIPGQASQFIASLLLPNDPSLPMLPADANAAPDKLTYNVNEYVETALQSAFSQFTRLQQTNLLNLANWSIGGVYLGPATNDGQFNDPSKNNQVEEIANISTTVQLSDIQLTTPNGAAFNANALAQTQAGSNVSDPNPQILAQDNGLQSNVDGAAYTGSLANIQYEYLYDGNDQISLTPTDGANWLFGGGSNYTRLISTSAPGGGNDLLASSGGSFMASGAGDDIFIIPDANAADLSVVDTITGFHAGDIAALAGLAGGNWVYGWGGTTWNGDPNVLAMYANSTSQPGVSEQIIFAGFTAAEASLFNLNPESGTLVITENNGSGNAEAMASQSLISPATVGAETAKMRFITPAASPALSAAGIAEAVSASEKEFAALGLLSALYKLTPTGPGAEDVSSTAAAGAVVADVSASSAAATHTSLLAALADAIKSQPGLAVA